MAALNKITSDFLIIGGGVIGITVARAISIK
jgi:L-2-hydroxyglutarate oxidase LhgO